VPAQHAASGHLPQGLRRPAHPMSGKKPRTVEAELQLQPKRNKSKRRVWSMEWSCSTSDFSSFPFPKNLLFGLALCSLSLLLLQWERNQTLAAELCDRLAPVSGDCVSLQPFLQVTNYSTWLLSKSKNIQGAVPMWMLVVDSIKEMGWSEYSYRVVVEHSIRHRLINMIHDGDSSYHQYIGK